MLPYEKGLKREVNCGKVDREAYEARRTKSFCIKSDFGYILSCELLESQLTDNNIESENIAILCHGLGMAKYCSFKYAEIFLKLGYKVVIYDHRNHGHSGKALTTMGFYEKYDLKKIVDWCYENYGSDCRIVTHGESMGAATVLLHMGIDERITCVIADCAYSDLRELLKHQLKQYYHLPCFLVPIESCLAYLRAGFWFKEVSPVEAVKKTDTPVMFIHGKIDNLVPPYMSKQMYDYRSKNKAIYQVAKARHAESICKNRNDYIYHVEQFLKTYMK
jgi:fermentation-respiration switch protein FrsA (DUF1100 family)